MKNAFLIALITALTFSCGDENSKNQRIVSDSSGNLNNISVVVDNEMWSGSVGEAIRATLATTIDGLPQDEPMFNMNQIPPSVFSGFVTKNRTILKIELNNKTEIITINTNKNKSKLKLLSLIYSFF